MRIKRALLHGMVTIALVVSTNDKGAGAEPDLGGSPPGVVVALAASVTGTAQRVLELPQGARNLWRTEKRTAQC